MLRLSGQKELERGTRLLLQAVDSFFGQSLTAGAARGLLIVGRKAFVAFADPCLRACWLARTEYSACFIERGR